MDVPLGLITSRNFLMGNLLFSKDLKSVSAFNKHYIHVLLACPHGAFQSQFYITKWKKKKQEKIKIKILFRRGLISKLRGGFTWMLFLAAKRWFNRIISFSFIAIQKPFTHYTILCFGIFCKFLGDFWVYLEGDIRINIRRD